MREKYLGLLNWLEVSCNLVFFLKKGKKTGAHFVFFGFCVHLSFNHERARLAFNLVLYSMELEDISGRFKNSMSGP